MARPNGVPNWTTVLVLGLVLCAIVLITALHGYSLHLRGGPIEVEMHPGVRSAALRPAGSG